MDLSGPLPGILDPCAVLSAQVLLPALNFPMLRTASRKHQVPLCMAFCMHTRHALPSAHAPHAATPRFSALNQRCVVRCALQDPCQLCRGACIGDWNAVYGRQGGRITFLPADSTRAAAVQLRLEGGVQAIISLVRLQYGAHVWIVREHVRIVRGARSGGELHVWSAKLAATHVIPFFLLSMDSFMTAMCTLGMRTRAPARELAVPFVSLVPCI